MDINERLAEIAQYRMMQKQIEAELNKLEGELKQYMLSEGLIEVVGDEHTATYKPVTSSKFDSTRFKADHADMYEMYRKASTSMRFTFA